MRVPNHLAIIMDGNGRWAEQRHLPRIAGHKKGVETVQVVVRECLSLGIPYVTLYAFSSENWGRPSTEVNALMDLLCRYLTGELRFLQEKEIRLKVIGEMERLPPSVVRVLQDTMAQTAANERMVLTLALSYGGRGEIIRAVRRLAESALEGRLRLSELDEKVFSGALDTALLPDPDLLIRTSGEMRISNFLLWQLAYSELYFTEILWPDFGVKELRSALEQFSSRQRRFGLTSEQIVDEDSDSGRGQH